MIHNDEQLAVVREQLAIAEHALKALRQQVKNPRNFAVFSEGPVHQIKELKGEIEAYQKKAKPKANSSAKKRKAKKQEKV